ncbi:MAG TPA: tetratricopeptide repeat protein [Ignavibacteria bacterium]|mgnify:CR=1 FL=1|nr:tetratricopeptide repeat protein [Ignavibacteria bacterium]
MQNLNLKLLTFLFLAVTIMSCSNQTKKKTEDQYLTEAKTQLDSAKYNESIVTYREFIKEYPKSDKAIFAYNQIAGIQIESLKNPADGIKTYTELVEKFPDTKEAKQSLFMVAFIYDETLKDKPNAIKSYQNFLAKYPTDTDPNDKMSESAKTMLEVLQSGKSIEEMIQSNIEKMGNQSSSDSTKVKVTEDKIEKMNKETTKEDPKMPPNKDQKKKADEDPDVDSKK